MGDEALIPHGHVMKIIFNAPRVVIGVNRLKINCKLHVGFMLNFLVTFGQLKKRTY